MSKKKQRRSRHVPLRTCLVCHDKKDKRQLTRIVRTPDRGVVVDPTGKRNGRGAYVCHQPDCWNKLLATPALLQQALRTNVAADELAAIAAHKQTRIDDPAKA